MKIHQLFRTFLDWKRGVLFPTGDPVRLWIETSSKCNLACPLCLNRTLEKHDHGLMDYSLFCSIIDQLHPGRQDAYLHHRGEPLLHPDLAKMVEYASDAGIKTRIHTNGVLLNREMSIGLVKSGLEQITFSIDSLNSKEYEKTRPGSDLNKVLENLNDFLAIRDDLGREKPIVHLLLMSNDSEKVILNTQISHKPDKIIRRKEHNWAGSLSSEKTGYSGKLLKCTFPWYAMVILFDGRVCLCPQDFFGKMFIGNVKTSSLKDLWISDKAADIRKKLIERKFADTDPCNGCDRIRRKNLFGIPVEYLSKFLREML
ncbi:MAG: SPASM domain-containing protein [Candidatus Theseobacter exili]|nr:SPASM domain-containing protein [Candidatus Theseobacter exili]